MTTKYDMYITCLSIDMDPHPTPYLKSGFYHSLAMSIEGYCGLPMYMMWTYPFNDISLVYKGWDLGT